jgi:hypothetical protein
LHDVPVVCSDDKFEPAEQRAAVTQAIRIADERAAMGGEDEDEPIRVGDQFFDNYDFDSLDTTLAGCVHAASKTHDDVGSEARLILAVTSLARLSFVVALGKNNLSDIAADYEDLAKAGEAAAQRAIFGDAAIKQPLLTISR